MRRLLFIVFICLSVPVVAQQDSIRYQAPDPIKAVWLGAIFPGAGQIYNRSYWKLPIVYSAFMGCGYAISWTHNRYSNYKIAYLDLYKDVQAGTVSEDASKSYIAVIPDGYDLNRVGGASTWMNTLKNRQSTYRRYRDYSILATVIVYALSLIDAYVDAQLFDYDISPNLSLNIEPQIYYDLQHQRSAEIKLAIQF
ncbi:MAG: hypothetical protein II901_02685 [Paludibacteraceae bacterium]|nr:hypothetical protein [Paludibacteraceae bacterium]